MIEAPGTVTVCEDGSVDVRGFIFKAPYEPDASTEGVKWAIDVLQSQLSKGVGVSPYTPEVAPAATRPAACPPAVLSPVAESPNHARA